jgi:hypothetical protein
MGTIKIRNVERIGKNPQAKRDTPTPKTTTSDFENYKNKVWRENRGRGFDYEGIGKEIGMNANPHPSG